MKRKPSSSKANAPHSRQFALFQKIGFQLSAFSMLSILLVGILSMGFLTYGSSQLVANINEERSQTALKTMQYILEDEKAGVQQSVQELSGNSALQAAVQGGDDMSAALQIASAELASSADFVIITDGQGNILTSSGSGKAGDSAADRESIKLALTGKSSVQIETGSDPALCISAGAPIRNTAGSIIGTVAVGYSLVDTSFLDRMKDLTGNDFTIFLGDERINTTITNQGQRVIGTKLDASISKTVLTDHQTYLGKAVLLGESYITIYQPITDGAGATVAIFCAAIPLAGTNAAMHTFMIISAALEVLLLAVVSGVLAFFLRRRIARPLSEMVTVATALSRGDLNADLQYHSKDELGTLADALRVTASSLQSYIHDISDKLGQMSRGDMRLSMDLRYEGDFTAIHDALKNIAATLNGTLLIISRTADQVNTGADQVSSASQSLASGAAEQAAAVEQLSASISNVSQQAEDNARSVQEANHSVMDASAGISASNEHMLRLSSAMGEISAAAEKISHITKLIEDIAFQTNILALNAAVESARAGTAGRGFAVVADEVRNLAAKSAEAASQAAELIGRSVSATSEGEKLTGETVRILQDSEEKTQLVAQAIRQIQSASVEQSNAIVQITQGLSQVSSVIQMNAATAEESSASSEELASLAQTLHTEVAKFKLTEDDTAAPVPPTAESLKTEHIQAPGAANPSGKY